MLYTRNTVHLVPVQFFSFFFFFEVSKYKNGKVKVTSPSRFTRAIIMHTAILMGGCIFVIFNNAKDT